MASMGLSQVLKTSFKGLSDGIKEYNSKDVDSSNYSYHSILSPDVVNSVSFCFDKSSNHLLAFESNSRVFVIKLLLSDDRLETSFDYQLIQDFIIGVKCSSVCLSPETNLGAIDSGLCLGVATNHFDIRIIRSDVQPNQPNVDLVDLRQHSDYINEISFEPFTGLMLASVSDDCSCCLWSIQTNGAQLHSRLTLTSAGVSVKWHKSEPNKLFIAEKKGLIRFYNCETKRPLMSCDCNRYPLLSADWSPNNSLFIGCVAGSEVFFWDTSLSSLPIDRRRGHPNGSQSIALFDSNIVATRGRPNNTVRVQNLTTDRILLEETTKAGAGIAWNSQMPVLAVGANKETSDETNLALHLKPHSMDNKIKD